MRCWPARPRLDRLRSPARRGLSQGGKIRRIFIKRVSCPGPFATFLVERLSGKAERGTEDHPAQALG